MSVETVDQAADEVLLGWFVDLGDDQAFAELVRRHGSMVRAACRRQLGGAPEVDDAFQAVFLVLARKAKTIRQPGLLGPWLHTVAVRAARKAWQALRRQQARERTGMIMPEPIAGPPSASEAWLAQVDEAFQQLPAKYREPMVLCELQGLRRADAAERLALPEGTLSSRLARARELLRRRLLQRGYALSAAALVAGLAGQASAGVPPALVDSITNAVHSGHAPTAVTAIAEGVLRAMVLSQLKWIVILSLALVMLLGGAGLVAWYVGAQPPGQAKSDRDLLQGTWKIVTGTMGGQAAPADELEQMKKWPFVFKGDTLTAKSKSEYKLAPTKTPKEIDIIPQDGPPNEKGQSFRGIYELKGDDLKICFSGPGMARPKSFDDAKGMQTMLLAFKRMTDGK